MENKMTIEQALNVLSQVTSQYKGTLQEHQTIIEAFKVLKEALEPKPEEKKTK
jgi:uncharacterized protein YoxC